MTKNLGRSLVPKKNIDHNFIIIYSYT